MIRGKTNYYEVLEVDPTIADDETIRLAYLRLSQKYHPSNETFGDPFKFKKVAEARMLLKSKRGRGRYEQWLQDASKDTET